MKQVGQLKNRCRRFVTFVYPLHVLPGHCKGRQLPFIPGSAVVGDVVSVCASPWWAACVGTCAASSSASVSSSTARAPPGSSFSGWLGEVVSWGEGGSRSQSRTGLVGQPGGPDPSPSCPTSGPGNRCSSRRSLSLSLRLWWSCLTESCSFALVVTVMVLISITTTAAIITRKRRRTCAWSEQPAYSVSS